MRTGKQTIFTYLLVAAILLLPLRLASAFEMQVPVDQKQGCAHSQQLADAHQQMKMDCCDSEQHQCNEGCQHCVHSVSSMALHFTLVTDPVSIDSAYLAENRSLFDGLPPSSLERPPRNLS